MPFMPGMAMSTTATSGIVRATTSSSAAPPPAAPTTAISVSFSSIERSAARIIRWSSASTTRILIWRILPYRPATCCARTSAPRSALSGGSGARLPCASTGRNNDLDRSAHAGLAVDLHLPAQQGGALAHPDQAKGPAHALFDAAEAPAVCLDFEGNF